MGHKGKLARLKRSTQQFEKDCDDKITYWTRSTYIVMSELLPWVAAAKALKQREGIGCQLSRQMSTTSIALSELLTDLSQHQGH